MERLLYSLISDKPTKRTLKIITILSDAKFDVSLSWLEKVLNVSRKTLLADLNRTQALLPKQCEMVISDKNVTLYNSTKESADTVIIDIVKDTLTYKLLSLIFNNEPGNIYHYAEILHISESSLRRKIVHLNESLKPFNCKIYPYTVSMTGDETNIRYFFYMFYYELQEISTSSAGDDEMVKHAGIYKQMCYEMKKNNVPLLNCGYRQITMWILVTKRRIEGGHYVTLKETLVNEIARRKSYNYFRVVYKNGMKAYVKNKPIPEKEIIWAYITNFGSIMYSYRSKEFAFCREEPKDLKVNDEIDKILNLMLEKFNIGKEVEKEFLYANKSYLINLLLLKQLSPLFQRISPALKQYTKSNLELVYLTWFNCLNEYKPLKLFDAEYIEDICSRLAMISSQFVYSDGLKLKRILFSFSGEPGFVSYLETFAKSILLDNIEAVFNITKLLDKNLIEDIKPDMVVCNYKENLVVNNVLVFKMSHIPTMKEWSMLRNKILYLSTEGNILSFE